MFYSLTFKSGNKKTGPIPVSTSSHATCPLSCGMREACYAMTGPLKMHWDAVTSGKKGVDFATFCAQVAKLPRGTLWRHNQAGDLPGEKDALEVRGLYALVRANRGRKGFTYTHKPLHSQEEREAVKYANDNGFTVNLSCDDISEVDAKSGLAIGPVVTVLPEDMGGRNTYTTPGGIKVVVCPATYRDDVTCATCRLCAHADRKVAVGFPVHGNKKGRYRKVAS